MNNGLSYKEGSEVLYVKYMGAQNVHATGSQ